jgi:tetratricopeptide (TPR) repeat protein
MIRGAVVLRGQDVAGGSLLYQLWREPLRRLVLMTDVTDAEASILKELVPDIEELLVRSVQNPASLDSRESQQRLIGTVVSLFQQVEQPVVLILEDLQWAVESLDVVKRLIGITRDQPLLIIGTYRDDEAPSLPDWLPGTQVMKLARLDDRAITSLIGSMLGTTAPQPKLTELIKRETEGNAYFMVEIMRLLAEDAGRLADIGRVTLPPSVFAGGIKEVIQRRLSRVPAWGQSALKLAAVAGRALDLEVLSQVVPDLERWLTACANAAVLEVHDGQWRFAHDKLREALLIDLTPAERPLLHRDIASAIEATYPDDDQWTAVLLEHWREAGDTPREIDYARRAAEQYMAVSNMQAALRIVERTLPIVTNKRTRAIFLHLLGKSRFRLGDIEQALVSLQDGLALAREVDDHATVARCYNTLGNVHARQSNMAEARHIYEQSLEIAQQLQDWSLVALNLEQIGDVSGFQSDFDTARSYYEQGLRISREHNNQRGIAGNLAGLGWVASGRSEYAASIDHFQQAAAVAEAIGDRATMAAALGNLGALAAALGEYDTAAEYYQRQLLIHHDTGLTAGSAWSLWALSRTMYFQGDLESATDYNEQSLAMHRELGAKTYIAAGLRVQGEIALARGAYAEAQRRQEEALALSREIGVRMGVVAGLCLVGQALSVQGDLAAAQQHFEEGLALSREYKFMDSIADALSGLGYVATCRGDLAHAHDYYEEALEVVRSNHLKVGTVAVLLRLGLLDAIRGQLQSALVKLEEAVQIARDIGLRIHRAAGLVQLGFVRLEMAEPDTALEHFVQALRLTHVNGAMPVMLEALIGIAEWHVRNGDRDFADNLLGAFGDQPPLPADVITLRLKPLRDSLTLSPGAAAFDPGAAGAIAHKVLSLNDRTSSPA